MTSLWQRFLIDQQIEEESFLHKSFYIVLIVALLWYIWRQSNKKVINNPDDESIENDLLDNAYTEEDASQPEGRSRATTTERQYSAYNPKKTKSKKNAISAEQSLHYQFIKSLCKQSKRRILLTMVNQRKMKKQGKDITTEILGIRDEFMTLNNVASNNVINNDQILKICRCFVYTKGAESLHHIGWIIDETCPNCYVCSTKFTLFRRKHHCRKCGNIICKSCLVKSSITSKEKRMIVCKNCHEIRLLSNSSSFSFPVLGIKVSYLNKFIEEECGGIQNLKGLTILQVRDQYIKPLTYHCQTSFVELLKSEGGQSIDDIGIANIYISYAWNTEFLMIIETILNYFEKNAKIYENEMEPILWMDLFCINQFQKILQNIDHHWLSTHFLSSISQIHQTLLIMPTPPPVPVPLPAPHRPSLPVSSFSALIRSAPTNYNNNPHDRINNNNNRNSPPPIAAVGPVVSNDEDEDEDEEDQQDNGHKGSGQELELVTGSGKRHPTNSNNNKTNPRRSSSHSPLLAAESSSSPSMKSQSIWENPTPFKRSWCLWELYCSFITSCKFQLVLSDEDAERFLEEIIMNEQDALSTLNKFLSAISTQSSQSYYIEDQKKLHAIFKEFTNYSLSNQILSYSLRNWFIHWITDNIQQEKDYHIKLKLKSFLILLFQEQKLFPAAEILLLELIEKKKKNLLQEDHIEIILEYIHLIYLYYKQKKFSLALTLALENYSKLKTILQEKHEITLNLYKMIAILYEHVGKYDLAEQYYLSYGIKLKNKFNNQEKNMEIMQFYEIVSKFYMKQGRFDLSESYLKQIYSFYKEIYPENSHPVLSIMSSLADIYLKRGNYIESQYFHEIVMEKRKVYFHLEQSNNNNHNKETNNKDSGTAAATGGGGLSHQQYQYQVITLQSMQSLAKFYMKTFQFALAENIFHEVYLKSIDLFGENDLESIQCMLSFGLFYLEQNIFEKANDLLQRALHHVTELYGENHLVTFQIRYAIALIYERQMKLDISETLLLILLEKIYDYWNYYLFHHIHHHSGQGQHPTGGTRSSRVFSEASIADPSAFLSTNPEKLSSDPAVPSSGATLPPSSALSSQGMMMFRKNPTIIHILNNYDAEDHDETIITLYVQVINSIALNYQKQGKPDLAKQFFRVVLRQAFRPSPPAAANATNMNSSTKIISSAVTPAAIPASVLSSTFDHPPRSSDILMGDLSPTSSHHHQSSLLPPPSFIASGPGGERSSLSLLVHERMPSAIVNSPAPNANDGDEFNARDSTVQPSKKRHGHHRGSPTPPVTTSALAASNNNSHRHQINPNDYENIFTIPAHHPDLLLICNNLANLYQMEGYYSLAEHYYKLVLNKCLIIFHELHIRIIACMINLGDLYLRQALYSLAESYYKKALEKLEMIQNLQPIQDHPHQDLLAAAAAIDPSFHPFPHHPNHPHAVNPSGTTAGVVVVPVSPHLHAGPVAVTPVVPTEGIEIPTIANNNSNNNNNHPTSPHAHAHHTHAHHHFTPKNIRIPQHHFPYLLQQLAVLYEQIGKYELAERFLHNAFQYSEVIFGSEHPITSKLKIRLEEFRDQQGEHERLAFHRQRILEAYEETDI